MYQIVTLLEAGSSALFEPETTEHQNNGGISDDQADFVPKFGFRTFSTFDSK
jgi:hypothetical protein